MADPTPPNLKLDLRWVQALSHPLRVAILEVLYGEDASPKEIGELFGVKLTHIAYHCRVLLGAGYIEEIRKVRRRGAYEHFYRVTPQGSFGHQRWRSLPRALRGHPTAEALASFMRVAVRALRSGAIDDRDDTVLNWMPMTVDSVGWETAVAVLHAAQVQLEEIHEECRDRNAASTGDLIHIAVGLAAFELSPLPLDRRLRGS